MFNSSTPLLRPSADPDSWYYGPKPAGRHELLTEHERNSVVQAIALLRLEGYSVTSGIISDIARGVVRRLRPQLLENTSYTSHPRAADPEPVQRDETRYLLKDGKQVKRDRADEAVRKADVKRLKAESKAKQNAINK
eukprot:PhM_4_TR10507/c2_g1_i2/m.106147